MSRTGDKPTSDLFFAPIKKLHLEGYQGMSRYAHWYCPPSYPLTFNSLQGQVVLDLSTEYSVCFQDMPQAFCHVTKSVPISQFTKFSEVKTEHGERAQPRAETDVAFVMLIDYLKSWKSSPTPHSIPGTLLVSGPPEVT